MVGARRRRPETAHEAIKENAVAVALAMREQGAAPDLLGTASPPTIGFRLDRAQLDAALADKAAFTGAAQAQVADVVTAAEKLIARYPTLRNTHRHRFCRADSVAATRPIRRGRADHSSVYAP